MELTIRTATLAERLYAYEQSTRIAEKCGSPGYLFGELDNTGSVFLNSWVRNVPSENTPEFKAEFNTVLDMLRFDERYGHVIKNRAAMIGFCFAHPDGQLADRQEYVFRADTKDYAYLIRCAPNAEDNHAHVYPYRRDLLDRHMKQAEKGIRFVGPDNREKFRIPDGESVRIISGEGMIRDHVARYVDDRHVEIGFNDFHDIREFAKRLERNGSKIIPMRSTLPDKCYSVLPSSDEIIIIQKGKNGYSRTDKYGHDHAESQAIAGEYNDRNGVTRAQEAAMLAGFLFGWDTPPLTRKTTTSRATLLIPSARTGVMLDDRAKIPDLEQLRSGVWGLACRLGGAVPGAVRG